MFIPLDPFLVRRDLRDNRIYNVQGHVFSPLRNLQILFVFNNTKTPIRKLNIYRDLFVNRFLNTNRIQAITSGMLPSYSFSELHTLSLADNQIRYIADGALSLPSLAHL